MDWPILLGLASLLATAIGSGAAVFALRSPRPPVPAVGTVDPAPALPLLKRRAAGTRLTTDVLQILARFVFVSHDGRVPFGTLDWMVSSVFLDLFTACTYPRYRRMVAKLVAAWVVRSSGADRPTHVAVPKEGNVILAAAVAGELGVGVVVVRTLIPAIRFGDPVEGSLAGGASVVLVDDIAADGEMLARAIRQVREHGGRITRCVCAVERMDGNSRGRLAEHDVRLYAPIQLDEGTLRELAQLPVSSPAFPAPRGDEAAPHAEPASADPPAE